MRIFECSKNVILLLQRGASIDILCTDLVSNIFSIHDQIVIFCCISKKACSARSPSGNQVDGLPLAASNATREEGRALWTKTIYGNGPLQMRCAADLSIRSQPNFQQSQIRCTGKFLYGRRVHYYHRCGAQGTNRFCHMMNMLTFH